MDQTVKIGAAAPRVDGRLKVTGEARYASDTPLANPAYAFLATSAIARGRIAEIDDSASRAVPGMLDILTHANTADAIRQTKLFSDGGYVGSTIMPLGSDRIWHGGQIVAVYHEESSVLDVLRAPGVNACVIAFGEASPPRARIGAIRDALADIIKGAPGCRRSETGEMAGAGRQPLHGALRSWSAHSLTERLAGVLNVVSS